jgi:hypothetical protein
MPPTYPIRKRPTVPPQPARLEYPKSWDASRGENVAIVERAGSHGVDERRLRRGEAFFTADNAGLGVAAPASGQRERRVDAALVITCGETAKIIHQSFALECQDSGGNHARIYL